MGRIVGLDFGTVRIGVAVSDERRVIARGKSVLRNTAGCIQDLEKMLQEEGAIDKIVVGLPLKLNGQESDMTVKAKAFAKALEAHFSCPVELWDERLTSALVERSLVEAGVKRKKRAELSDTLSAVVILQSYLDRLC